jgi:uncharacterized protein (TIGR02444 family)
MTEPQSETTPFWRFSLHVYRQPGVADACVALQDGCGVDVNVLLYLLWRAADRRLFSADDVKAIEATVRDWRNLTVIPLRELRRKLKGTPTAIEPLKQEGFRTKIKGVELEAERLQQEALYALAHAGPMGGEAAPPDAARGNVAAYEHVLAASFPKTAVEAVLAAFDGLKHGDFVRGPTP